MTKKDAFAKTREVVPRAQELFAQAQTWEVLYIVINHVPSFADNEGVRSQADVIAAIDDARRAHADGQPYTLDRVPDAFGLRDVVARLLEKDKTPPRPKTTYRDGLAARLTEAQKFPPVNWSRITMRKDKDTK